MWRVARLALIWLLAVALPLQGLSAATMLACNPDQHDHAPAVATGHVHADASVELHSDAQVPGASSHQHAGLDPSGAGETSLDDGASQKCSACASCCTSAAVPSQAVSFDAVKPTDFFAPLVARTIAAYVTEGLERPPRSVFA